MKFKDFLNESSSSSDVDSIVKKLSKLTDHNDHNTASMEFAKFLGATRIEKVLNHVSAIADITRSMPSDLSKFRYSLLQELKVLLYQKFDKSDADRIWSSL